MRRKDIKSRWVFKRKPHTDGSLDKYKARLVAKGFSKRYGTYYTEAYSPVVRHSALRIIFVVVVSKHMKHLQLDIKTVFMNSKLQEESYLEPAEGYEGDKCHVWILLRAL